MTIAVKKKRLPKHFRSKIPPTIRNLKNYLPLLEKIQEFHFISSEQLLALSATSKDRTYEKLKRLFHNGYVERYQFPTTEFCAGSPIMIYTLCRKGAEVLVENDPERFGEIYYPKQRRGYSLVSHALMVSNLRTCLTLALREKKLVELVDWRQGRAIEDLLRGLSVTRIPVKPDAYFSVKTSRGVIHYFVEADRGTMKLARFYAKIARYRKFFRQHRNHLPARFRVLTITPTARRAENLRTITIKGDPKGQGSERFLFTDETRFNLATPSSILAPICSMGYAQAERKQFSLLM